jgi:hypothetical protein
MKKSATLNGVKGLLCLENGILRFARNDGHSAGFSSEVYGSAATR